MPEREINSIADAVNIIDDVITREIEWADGPTAVSYTHLTLPTTPYV